MKNENTTIENSLETLINLFAQNSEDAWIEKEGIRICIHGNEETDFNNNQILKRIGTTTNGLKKMLKENNISIIELMHDDACLHLTISNESAKLLEIEGSEL